MGVNSLFPVSSPQTYLMMQENCASQNNKYLIHQNGCDKKVKRHRIYLKYLSCYIYLLKREKNGFIMLPSRL